MENQEKWQRFENDMETYNLRIKPFIVISETSFYNGTPCHGWEDSLHKEGYGRIFIKGKSYSTHRLAYICHYGPIKERLVIDHLCENTNCCNPLHLEPITQSINTLRGKTPKVTREYHALKTHCPQGHEYTPENTYLKEYLNENGTIYTKRQCVICCKDRNKWDETKLARKAVRMNKKIEEVTLEDGRSTRPIESYAKARRTHCKRGHELTPENIRVRIINDKKYGQREKHDCKECMKLRGDIK